MEKQKNCAIHCTVKECANNCCTENYCSLNSINIGTHEPNPSKPECCDCNSFVKKNG